jgi:hypothetical protein
MLKVSALANANVRAPRPAMVFCEMHTDDRARGWEAAVMKLLAQTGVASLLCALTLIEASPAMAQSDDVPLIMFKPQGAGALTKPHLEKLYAAIRKRSEKAKGQVLPLTRTEVWMVPKDNVDGVRKTAARHGVVMSRLSEAWNRVFQKAPSETKITARQRSLMERAKASLAALAVGVMASPRPPIVEYALTKNADQRDAAKEATRITVTLSDETTLTVDRMSVEVRVDLCVWRGLVEGTGEPATLMWWPDGRMAGTVQHAGRIYSIRHLGGELHAVVEMAENRMPAEHAPLVPRARSDDPTLRDDPLVQQGDAGTARPRKSGAKSSAERTATARAEVASKGDAKDVIIDVIVAYTRKAAANYADIKQDLIGLAIEEANESFRASDIAGVRVRLVHSYETSYIEEGSHFEHVWRFADKGDGYMDEIHALRDKYRADVALLVVDDAIGCGLATRVYADAEDAFAVVHHECAAATYSVAHEIGHIIGARHDLNLDKTMSPFPFGHGYVNGKKWRDIMSYKESCGGCPRVPIWSSPLVKVRGEPAGTPDLDNARVIREQAARVAAFR